MLNPNLDLKKLAQEYQLDNRLRIENVFDQDVAERLSATLRHAPFDYIFHTDGQNRVVSESEMASFSSSQKKSIHANTMKSASAGVGFIYCGYMMKERDEPADASLAYLHELYDSLNSEEVLEAFRQITGRSELSGVDGQYTRYTQGQFLTRHSDDIVKEHRSVAFVFGLTKQWHPDWGGLLQFYEEDGTPRDAWLPAFNALSLFDVRHIHGVSYVTPFAAGKRYSLTGWFTSD